MRSIGLYSFICLYCVTVLVVLYVESVFVVSVWLLGACLATLLVAYSALGSVRAVIPQAILGILLGFIRVELVPPSMPLELAPMINQKVTVTGTIVSIPDLRETSQKLTIEIPVNKEQTRILATVPLYPALHAGDTLRLSGTLQKPAPFETDGGRTFAYDTFLRKDGIYALMPTAGVEKTGTSPSIWLYVLRSLEGLKATLTKALGIALPEPESALAVGILVGGKQGLGARLIEDFTTSGMLQIIVLSGFNVMIVAAALMRVLTHFPKRIAFVIASSSIFGFVLMAGAGSSAIRAGLMAGFALAARTFSKPRNPLKLCIT
jgi:competence protein ComEC